MKLSIDPVVDVAKVNFESLAWGMSAEHNPVFQIQIGGHTVAVELTPEQARDFCCGGIVAAAQTFEMKQRMAGQAKAAGRVILGH
jgi:NOL1/NOP2/fmu family ribosome biogenesis protein